MNEKAQTALGFLGLFGLMYGCTAIISEPADTRPGAHCYSSYSGENRELAAAVQDQLNDPDSYEHIGTTFVPKPNGLGYARMEFRAKNGFGALIASEAIGEFNLETCELTDWSMR